MSGQQTKLQKWQNSQPASWADVKEREPQDQLLRIADFTATKGMLVAASQMAPTKRAAIATRDNRTFWECRGRNKDRRSRQRRKRDRKLQGAREEKLHTPVTRRTLKSCQISEIKDHGHPTTRAVITGPPEALTPDSAES